MPNSSKFKSVRKTNVIRIQSGNKWIEHTAFGEMQCALSVFNVGQNEFAKVVDIDFIIDEDQNLTPRQVKGIITRVGSGTKVVLLGDPQQINHPLLDEQTNGLSYAAEKMKGSTLCYQVTMRPDECERSELAMDVAGRM